MKIHTLSIRTIWQDTHTFLNAHIVHLLTSCPFRCTHTPLTEVIGFAGGLVGFGVAIGFVGGLLGLGCVVAGGLGWVGFDCVTTTLGLVGVVGFGLFFLYVIVNDF